MHARPLYLLLLFAIVACGPEPADTVLTNARVYTFDWPDPASDGTPAPEAPYSGTEGWTPDAEAIAIADGRVVFVGTNQEVARYQGATTTVVDLEGATVFPGLVDSHTHITELGARLALVDLVGVETEEEAVRRAAERAATVPAGTWVLGTGWDEGAWANRYPDARLLSEAVPDHPVYLRSLHGFAGWGNRLAFETAGIDALTPTPVGGEIRRNRAGEPTGLVLNRAVALLDEAIPSPTAKELDERLLSGLQEMARSGYVAVHYAGVAAESMDALERLAARDALPVRVYAMLSGRDTTLLAEWLDRGPTTQPDAMLVVRSVKAYYDGALGSRGARMIEDYSDQPGHRGVSGAGYGFDRGWIAPMMGAGFQVGIHAIGDAGNRETLDFIAQAYADYPSARSGRHRIEHAQVVHPNDFARFAELGLTASMEPPHAVEDKPWAEERIGPDRIKGAYAWRTMRRAGVPLIFNADLPGSDWSPFYGLHAAITRTDKEGVPAGGWYPEQAVTPEEALRAYSTWAARAAFMEGSTGVVAAGRWADFTVVDRDVLSGPASSVLDASVVMTMVGGEVVYQP